MLIGDFLSFFGRILFILMIIVFLSTVFFMWQHMQRLSQDLNPVFKKAELSFALTEMTQAKLKLFQKKKKASFNKGNWIHDLLLLWSIRQTFHPEKTDTKKNRRASRKRYRRDLVNSILNRMHDAETL